MYQIIFNPKTAEWEIRIHGFLIMWRKVQGKSFASHAEAKSYIKQLGLEEVYTDATHLISSPLGTVRNEANYQVRIA